MKVLWSQEALNQLSAIEDFIAKDSPQRTASFVLRIIRHAEKNLIQTPLMGRVVPEVGNPSLRELIFKGYRIVYRQSPDRVDVVTVFEGHRKLRKDEIG